MDHLTLRMNVALLFALAAPLTATAAVRQICPQPWVCRRMDVTVNATYALGAVKTPVSTVIRTGFLRESPNAPFRGNIVYLEGLGDSMLNHQPLFKLLTANGFRVISFDYPGQGGSSGTMNATRIEGIAQLADLVWKSPGFVRNPESQTKPIYIGWSTGGLAAYMIATEEMAEKVILIAPGLSPNVVVGEGLHSWPVDEITLESLTTDRYSVNHPNPHLESIRPNSPMVVPHFASNLLVTSMRAAGRTVPESVPGLVLLSGPKDTYVNACKTRVILHGGWAPKCDGFPDVGVESPGGATHFSIQEYPAALHEIDNESASVQRAAFRDILNFLMH